MKEHGHYCFEWQGDLLILSLKGAFNEAAILSFFKDVLESVVTSKKTQWVLLSSLDRTMMGTPNVLEIIKNAYRWGETNGCVSAAISGANVVISKVFSDFFELISYDTKLFDHKQDAVDWLNVQLEKKSSNDLTVE